jgi:hypothetical protein
MAADWILAASGLVGAIIGGAISYFAQKSIRNADKESDRRALAGAIAAEIEAYLHLMSLRNHANHARALAQRIRAASGEKLRGFLDKDSKPLDEFPVIKTQLGNIGILGDVCFELVKFYAVLSGVQSTVISAEHGKYDGLSAAALADMIDQEAGVWESALALGASVVPRLKQIANLSP